MAGEAQGLGGDQDAGQAVAALAGLLVDEGLLQRVRAAGIAQALDGGDRLPGDAPHRLGAAFLRRAIDQDHAAAALLEPAAETRAHQAELVAQHVEQRRLFVLDRHADRFAIDREIKRVRHDRYSLTSWPGNRVRPKAGPVVNLSRSFTFVVVCTM